MTTWSEHIDNASEETTDKEKTIDATCTAKMVVCPLVAAMLAAEAVIKRQQRQGVVNGGIRYLVSS